MDRGARADRAVLATVPGYPGLLGERMEPFQGSSTGTEHPAGAAPAPPARATRARARRLVQGVLAAALAACIIATVAAWAGHTSAGRPATYSETARLTYSGAAAPSVPYPDGQVHPGDPLYVKLVKRLELRVGYAFEPNGVSSTKPVGSYDVVASVVNDAGLKRDITLAKAVPFDGDRAFGTVSVDLAGLERMQRSFENQTGVAPRAAKISFAAVLNASRSLAGTPLSSTLTPRLDFTFAPWLLVPATSGAGASPSSIDRTGAVPPAGPTARSFDVLGMQLSTGWARLLSSVMLVLLGAGLALALRRRGATGPAPRPDFASGANAGAATTTTDVGALGGSAVLAGGDFDVARTREHSRRRRLWHVFFYLVPVAAFMFYRAATQNPIKPGLPHLMASEWLMVVFIIVIAVGTVAMFAGGGRSPHVRYDPSEINVSLADVVGLGGVKDEVVKSLNLFLGYQTFRDVMGGNPRRGVLFEGPPGTGKTYMAKAMAREANVPFLFVSSTAFQSHFYGMTGRKIRNFFKQLRKAAREEGGAVGFIEEIDAIAGARSGMRASPLPATLASDPLGRGVERNTSEGIAGVVNELLIQLQSFDEPTTGQKLRGMLIDRLNLWLPADRRVAKKPPAPSNILVIGATNRAADLDPALVRPGRFDRSIYFGLPSRSGRLDIIDYYLGKKAHSAELDDPARRETLAALTAGYSPVMIEHLMDEALVWALRRGDRELSWEDLQHAKMTEEIGLAQPVEYTEAERRTIATHEAGHATVAWLVGKGYIPGGSAADVSSALVAIFAAIWSVQNNQTGKTIT